MTNHDIQDALSTYGSGLVVMHQQALHTDRIAMAQQNRLHTEQRELAEHNRIHAQAAADRAAIELKWTEWWQPAKPPKLEEEFIATVPKPRAKENLAKQRGEVCHEEFTTNNEPSTIGNLGHTLKDSERLITNERKQPAETLINTEPSNREGQQRDSSESATNVIELSYD